MYPVAVEIVSAPWRLFDLASGEIKASTATGCTAQFSRLVNAAYVGFQPVTLLGLDVKTLGFQPLLGFEKQAEMKQNSLIPTSECT